MTRTLRAALAVGCLLGAYVVAAVGIALPAYAAARLLVDAGPGPAAVVAVVVLAIAVLLAVAVSATLRAPLPEQAGLRLGRPGHPDLWRELDELAGRVGTRAPDEVLLVPEPVVDLGEDIGRLGLVGGTRRLRLGAPLLLTLQRSELRALVAHELGHHRRGPLGLWATAYRGQQHLGALASRDDLPRPLARLLRACARGYLRVAGPVNQRQEEQADDLAAAIAGTAAATAALQRVPAVVVVWDRYVREHAFVAPGLRPTRLLESFGELWDEPEVQAWLAAVRDQPAGHEPPPHDAHPTLEQRVDRLRERPVEVAPNEAPARHVVTRWGPRLAELERTMFGQSDLRQASWDEIADRVGRREILVRASRLVEPLDLAVTDLTSWRSRALVRGLLPAEASPATVRDTAVDLVAAAIEAALLESGGAHLVATWSTTWLLVDDSGRSLDVASTVRAAYDDDARRGALLALVQDEGLAGYRARPPGAPGTPRPEQLLGLGAGRTAG